MIRGLLALKVTQGRQDLKATQALRALRETQDRQGQLVLHPPLLVPQGPLALPQLLQGPRVPRGRLVQQALRVLKDLLVLKVFRVFQETLGPLEQIQLLQDQQVRLGQREPTVL